MMDAAVLHSLGKSPRFEQFPEPKAGEDETIVRVLAAALKPVDKQMASGAHYGSPRELPVVCGLDGVGCLEDGRRVFFGGPRRPYGAMARYTVVHRARCWPIPAEVNDVTAAALVNPGMSAWLSLAFRARLAQGETVLVLGATGVTGKLAVQIAKILGAGRVVAAGRDERVLSTLHQHGADVTIQLNRSAQELTAAFAHEAGNKGFDVILDYLWGRPTETLLAAITRADMGAEHSSSPRLVQAGENAGPTITLPAAALRSSGLEIMGAGTGAVPPLNVLLDVFQQIMARAASGELTVDTERVPLAEVEGAWQREVRSGRRLVIIP